MSHYPCIQGKRTVRVPVDPVTEE